MKEIMDGQKDTPPSSISGDEITALNEEGMLYLEEVEEYDLDDDNMEEGSDEDDDTEMEPPEDHAVLVFDKHDGSVFCGDIHREGKMAVTGGEDDKAYVWNIETGEILMECLNHKDSVIFAGFSHDGSFVAAADMSGILKVYNCKKNEETGQEPWSLAYEYECEDISWATWHFEISAVAVGTITGNIYFLTVPTGEMKFLQGHHFRVECGKFFYDGVRLAAGYGDGVVKIWDLKTETVTHTLAPSMPDMRVTAIDVHPNNKIIVSINSEGRVVLTTAKTGKLVSQIDLENDLETVAFTKDTQLPLMAFGTLTGAVSIWDVSRIMLRHQCAKSNDDVGGVTKMIWERDQLVTGCLDGAVRIYDGRTGERTEMFTGHRSEILDLCYNSKAKIILTTSDDGTARIFKYSLMKEND